MSTIATFNVPIDQGPVPLTAFLTKVVSIRLPPANPATGVSARWAIFGKVVITNSHATAENAVAELLEGATVLDRTIVVIPGGKISQSLSVEGTLTTTPGAANCVQISCSISGGPGTAQLAQLIAISVDNFDPSQPC
jgi:hypothetical protein